MPVGKEKERKKEIFSVRRKGEIMKTPTHAHTSGKKCLLVA
ncbi:MAG: hypothetical protein ACTSYD_05365 [Candidatus Heimdallarchaeaceae archaeon]